MALIGRLGIGLALAVLGSAFATAQSGTGYTLQLDSTSAAFPILSIDYGTQNNVNVGSSSNGAGAGKATLSPVVVTFSAGGPQVAALLIDCINNVRLAKMVAAYSVNGTPEINVNFEGASVTSIQLPPVVNGTPLGDITVTFTVTKEETVLPPAANSVQTTTANREARTTIQLHSLPQKWMAPIHFLPIAPATNFAFTLKNVDTTGVKTVGITSIVSPRDAASGLPTGKIQFSPIQVTVDATKLADFLKYQASNQVIASGTLTLNRNMANGSASSVILDLKSVVVSAVNVSGQSGASPTATVTLNYQTLAIRTQ